MPPPPAQVNAQLDVWNTSTLGAPFVMTYQFETAQPGDLWMTFSGWTAMSGTDQAAIRTVLDEYEARRQRQIRPGHHSGRPRYQYRSRRPSPGEAGRAAAAFIRLGRRHQHHQAHGPLRRLSTTPPISLRRQQKTLLFHEIGHALTLKHRGNLRRRGQPSAAPYFRR